MQCMVLRKIYEWIGNKKLELIFRGTRDGMNKTSFHNKCDSQGPNICLIRNVKGHIFGGYSSISWSQSESFHSAPGSFLFTLTNIHNTEPTKFPTKNDNKEVYHSPEEGPLFGGGHDIGIRNDFINGSNWSSFPYTYQDTLGKGKSVFTGDLNNKNTALKIDELEAFRVI